MSEEQGGGEREDRGGRRGGRPQRLVMKIYGLSDGGHGDGRCVTVEETGDDRGEEG